MRTLLPKILIGSWELVDEGVFVAGHDRDEDLYGLLARVGDAGEVDHGDACAEAEATGFVGGGLSGSSVLR